MIEIQISLYKYKKRYLFKYANTYISISSRDISIYTKIEISLIKIQIPTRGDLEVRGHCP